VSRAEKLQIRLEWLTRRWWFYLLFVLLQFVIPPYASKGYKFPEELSDVIFNALGNAVIYQHYQFFPIFKVIPFILLIGIFVFRNKLTRSFNIYVSISYVLFAIGQNVAVTEKYGVAICTINVVMFLVVAAFWAWEAAVLRNDFTLIKQSVWRYWIVPLALLAFWYPLERRTLMPDFNPAYMFTNVAGVTFCMMTPVYVGLLTLYWPKVNMAVLRVTSLVGLIIALYNLLVNFVINPGRYWWNGVLHIPLLVISIYALVLSLKKVKSNVVV
jgi:hypothetical protein